MQVIRSYWKDHMVEADTLSEIPTTPLFNDRIYVYGEKSKEDIPALEAMGYDVHFIETETFDSPELAYGRKIITLCMGLHHFDEVLMLDWDCVPVKPIDDKFMEYMAEKPVQVPLYMHNVQNPFECSYPFNGGYAQPNMGFVYSRNKELGNELINFAMQYGITGMVDEWAMYMYAKPHKAEAYITMYHPRVCYAVDKDFYTIDPESEHAKLQLPLMLAVEASEDMDIYFKHIS